jgi:hypothetical protein
MEEPLAAAGDLILFPEKIVKGHLSWNGWQSTEIPLENLDVIEEGTKKSTPFLIFGALLLLVSLRGSWVYFTTAKIDDPRMTIFLIATIALLGWALLLAGFLHERRFASFRSGQKIIVGYSSRMPAFVARVKQQMQSIKALEDEAEKVPDIALQKIKF